MVERKTVLLFGAVALLTGCASNGAHQRHSNAAVDQIKEQRAACYAGTALAMDDGVSDAGTIGKAVSAHCRKYTEELIRLAASDRAQAARLIQQHADDVATTYVVELRRLKKLPA